MTAIFAASMTEWLTSHWFRLPLLVVGVVLVLVALWQRHRQVLAYCLGGVGVFLALFALGSLALPATNPRFFDNAASWLFTVAGGGIVLLIVLLLLTGFWNRYLAMILPAVLFVGLGGLLLVDAEYDIANLGQTIAEMRIRAPWWLLMLAVVPLVIALSYRRLTRHEFRPWLATGLRVLGVGVLAFALAEPFFAQASRTMTVLFVLDRSASIPQEPGVDKDNKPIDLRNKRIMRFINDSVNMRSADHVHDKVGLVVFGRRPRLELMPGEAPTARDATRFSLPQLPTIDDPNYTDIASALKLALASFPEGTARRVVLISDGNENIGNAEEQARQANKLGVQIDVLPLGKGVQNTEEVLIERVDAPPVIEQGARVPIRVSVRSHNPHIVVGRLILRQITDKEGTIILRPAQGADLGLEVETVDTGKKEANKEITSVRIVRVVRASPAGRAGIEEGEEITAVNGEVIDNAVAYHEKVAMAKGEVRLSIRRKPDRIIGVLEPPDPKRPATKNSRPARLKKGLNTFTFDRPLTDEQRSYSYEAEFQPLWVEELNDKGEVVSKQEGLAGDRVENNRASTHVVARGIGRVLFLENKAGDHKEIVNRLVEAGKGRFKVVAESVDILKDYQDLAKLAVFLSNFDCVIIANVPCERIPEDQQKVFRSNTHDQGCGLVMIGGPDSYGAGGWQKTPIEEALPVDCDLKQLKVQGKGGLVLIMHACEMAQGNFWEKKVAKLAVERLGPNDEVGILYWNFRDVWHVPMQVVGPNRQQILAKIDSMTPNDMPDFSPSLAMARQALNDPKKEFGAKHVIIISDGDPQVSDPRTLNLMKTQDKISIATIGIATHGGITDQNMTNIATIDPATGKKRFYKVDDPKKLPAIYIKETRLVSQSFIHKAQFTPRLIYRSGPTLKLPADDKGYMVPLGGFVRTTQKESPLVEVPIKTPPLGLQDEQFEFPVLAYWHYGLGKSVAFTSDAGAPHYWCKRWIEGEKGGEGIFASFWEQVIGWTLRPVESGRMVMHTEQRDGKIKITIEAKTAEGKPDTNLNLRGGLTTPNPKVGEQGKKDLTFVQKNSGVYEAEVKAEDAGSYFVNAQGTRRVPLLHKGVPVAEDGQKIDSKDGKFFLADKTEVRLEGSMLVSLDGKKRIPVKMTDEPTDGVRAGVTIPYSPEFFDLESNTALMNNLADMTKGKVFIDDDDALQEGAKEVFRDPEVRSRTSLPFHYWLLFLAAGVLLVDVAVRRLAFDANETSEQAKYVWARLRGMPVPPPAQREAVLRLRAKPGDAVTATQRATQRFEGRRGAHGRDFLDASAPEKPATPLPGGGGQTGELAPTKEQDAPKGETMDDLLEANPQAGEGPETEFSPTTHDEPSR